MSLTSRKISRMLALGGVAALAVTALAGCSGSDSGSTSADCTPAHEVTTMTQGDLTIASYDYPPATQIDGDGLTGMEGDLITKIAAMECLKLTVTSSGGAAAVIPSVQTGRADLGSGNWLRTKARAEIVYMSTPLWSDPQAIVSLTGLTSDELEGKKVGSVAGNLWNDSMQQWLGDNFTIYQDDESVYSDLAAGRIDALVASAASANYRFQDAPIDGATVVAVTPNTHVPAFDQVGQVMWPSSLDNSDLGKALDEDIESLRKDGTITEILKKYGIDPAVGEPGEPNEL